VLDELLFSFMHKPQNKADIAAYQSESLPGPIFPVLGVGHHDEGIQLLGRTLSRLHLSAGTSQKVATSDASGWDFSVTRMLWMRDAMRRIDCWARVSDSSSELQETIEDLLLVVGVLSSAHCFCISGIVYEFDFYGLMPSAHPSTSDSNSGMRGESLFDKIKRLLVVVGDDVAHDDLLSPEEKAALEATGTIVRAEESFEPYTYAFNSHIITYDTASGKYFGKFTNFEKLVVKLILSHGVYPADSIEYKQGVEAVAGGLHVLRHTPDLLPKYRTIVDALGYGHVQAVYCEDLSDIL